MTTNRNLLPHLTDMISNATDPGVNTDAPVSAPSLWFSQFKNKKRTVSDRLYLVVADKHLKSCAWI